ncbi:hypothetical protein IFM89_028331 [Coptis chinensis]|uniref:Protein FAR1-RELATED SEQUENCE n=1 Tax=Coptis chinensis TaxID=261450 RepID=A0A835M5A7_9MAGN|nr:hypothetical protein IFM89_028331 [Coptis chinensis]
MKNKKKNQSNSSLPPPPYHFLPPFYPPWSTYPGVWQFPPPGPPPHGFPITMPPLNCPPPGTIAGLRPQHPHFGFWPHPGGFTSPPIVMSPIMPQTSCQGSVVSLPTSSQAPTAIAPSQAPPPLRRRHSAAAGDPQQEGKAGQTQRVKSKKHNGIEKKSSHGHDKQEADVYVEHKSLKEDFQAKYRKCVYDSQKPEEFESGWKALLAMFCLDENSWLNGMYDMREHWVPLYLQDIFFAGMTTMQLGEGVNYFDGFVHDGTPLSEFIPQYEQAVKQRRNEEADEDFITMYTSVGSTSKHPIEEQAAKVFTRNMFTVFSHEFCESSGCFVRKITEEEPITSTERLNCAFNIIEEGMKNLSFTSAPSSDSPLKRLGIKQTLRRKRKCSACNQTGHYTTTCPQGSVIQSETSTNVTGSS